MTQKTTLAPKNQDTPSNDSQDAETVVRPVIYLNAIIRDLRRRAGISRPVFAEQVNIAVTTYRRWEEGGWPLTPEQQQRVMAHPAMADAARLAVEAGIESAAGTTLFRTTKAQGSEES